MNSNLFKELSNEQKLLLKQQVKAACLSILKRRIETADTAVKQAQDAANSEEKSSVGDKYETSRAMSQSDRDMNAKQLEEANRELAILNSIPVNTLHTKVSFGSLVVSKEYNFFIALGLGTVVIDGHPVITLSPLAPVASMLKDKKAGDCFAFNTKTIEITDVF